MVRLLALAIYGYTVIIPSILHTRTGMQYLCHYLVICCKFEHTIIIITIIIIIIIIIIICCKFEQYCV